jgi:hypothetical protein
MLAFLGGTGPEGRGLALRFALAGEEVLIGSRDRTRAQEAVERVKARVPQGRLWGVDNEEAAREGQVVFITVPFPAQRPLLEQLGHLLKGKVVVDVVAPLAFSAGRARATPVEEGSAAMQAQRLLPDSFVVAAFQNISAQDLLQPEREIEGDVVVCSDYDEPKRLVMSLAEKIRSLRAVDGDGLENARYVEELTALLLNINRIYRCRSMIKIMGLG